VIAWPPTGSDLSCIENVWGNVAKQLQGKTDMTAKIIEDAVLEEWVSTLHFLAMRVLYTSIRSRLKACLTEKDKSIKY
jgi:hypothetical protein